MEKIQDFILNPADLTTAVTAGSKPARKNHISYKPIVENGLDLVIERKSTRGTRIAAFIITQDQFYIKNEQGETQLMDADNLSKFLASAQTPITVENTCWIKELQKGKAFSEPLMRFLNIYSQLVKEGLVTYQQFLNTSGGGRYRSTVLAGLAEMTQKSLKIVKYAVKKASEITGLDAAGVITRTQGSRQYSTSVGFLEEPLNELNWLTLIELQYGVDNTKKLIDAFAESNLSIGCPVDDYIGLVSTVDSELAELITNVSTGYDGAYTYNGRGRRIYRNDAIREAAMEYFEKKNFKHNKECFEFDRMLEYMLSYQTEGFGTLRDFIDIWRDTLKNQALIYRTVKNKYPANLWTEHNRTTLKVNEIIKIREITDFEKSYEEAKSLEWETSENIFIVPKTPEDMVEEAFNQSNCLRSYIPEVAKGYRRIVFMRKKKLPDQSLLTIEVRADGSIGQVKGKHNRNATSSEMTAVRRWAEEKELIL